MPTRENPEGRLLTPSAYNKLLGQVQKLSVEAEQTTNHARVSVNWQIGARIIGARLSTNVGYHNSVLRDLAADSGLSVRVLQEAVAFHEAYAEPPDQPGLNWSHYRKLMSVPLPEREQLEAAAAENGWTARDLAAAIADFLESETGTVATIVRPTDPTYLYAATVTEVIDGDTVQADIDLGFAVTRHERLRLARVDAPEIKTPKGRAAKTHLIRLLDKAATLAITTERVDLHGRYVAHLFTSIVRAPILDCFQTGKHLNAALIAAGHAVIKAK